MRFDGEVTGQGASGWTVVIPVKHLSGAKSRMAAEGAVGLEALAMAFFQDTATAALQCPEVDRVVVATSDDRVATWAQAAGCLPFDDTAYPGINVAAAAAAASVVTAVAVLVSDLPCATAEGLGAALGAAAGHPMSFVADAAGTGTTLWARRAGVDARSKFGPGSRTAHREQGAVDLVEAALEPLGVITSGALARLRRDVDTPDDLRDALRLGVGRHTASAAAGLLER